MKIFRLILRLFSHARLLVACLIARPDLDRMARLIRAQDAEIKKLRGALLAAGKRLVRVESEIEFAKERLADKAGTARARILSTAQMFGGRN